MASLIDDIIEALKRPLPGEKAQYAMAPSMRRQKLCQDDDVRQAAVMILLYFKNQDWQVSYIKRVAHTGHERHRGQISFPGGTHDPEDQTLEETALREANEEIGIPIEKINILGRLSSLYIPVSNFNVHPYIGWVPEVPTFIPQPEEVEEILEIPIGHLKDSTYQKTMDMPINDGLVLKKVPYFDLNGEILWGATAMMTSEFLHLLEANKS